MNDILSQMRRKEDAIVRKLELRLKTRGNYENFGTNELREFSDYVRSQDIAYSVQCDFIQSLSRRIDGIQG